MSAQLLSPVADGKQSVNNKSMSRAGRMAEALGVPLRVPTNTVKKTNMDLSKLLSIVEVADRDDAHSSGDDRREAICSSARVHPVMQEKSKYIETAEKELQFMNAMKIGDGDAPARKMSRVRRLIAHRSLPETMPPEDPPVPLKPSPCFLATERKLTFIQKTTSPPVGHYNPRFAMVEIDAPSITIPRPKTTSPRLTGGDAARADNTSACSESAPSVESPRAAGMPRKLAVVTPSDVLNSTDNRSSYERSPRNADRPSPAFASKVPSVGSPQRAQRRPSRGNHSPPPAASSIINDVHFENFANRSCLVNMGRTVGRDAYQQVPQAPDRFYDPPTSNIKVANVFLGKYAARESRRTVPLTANDVLSPPRGDVPVLDGSHKYQRQPVLCDMKRQTSRDAKINNLIVHQMKQSVGTSEIPDKAVPEAPSRHTPMFHFKNFVPRKQPPPKVGVDAEYVPSYEVLSSTKHVFDQSWHFKKTRSRRKEPEPDGHVAVGTYDPAVDSISHHVRLARNIAFDKMPQRKLFTSAQQEALDGFRCSADDSYFKSKLKGDPMMRTHISREKRERLASPVK